jgi:hypothetical protein
MCPPVSFAMSASITRAGVLQLDQGICKCHSHNLQDSQGIVGEDARTHAHTHTHTQFRPHDSQQLSQELSDAVQKQRVLQGYEDLRVYSTRLVKAATQG